METASILIVIPCYNEAKRFPLQEYQSFLKSSENIQLCFVNDGSVDGTSGVIEQLRNEFPVLIHIAENQKNKGKAEAIRTGVQMAKNMSFDYVGYFDADLATPLSEARWMLSRAPAEVKTFIMGARVNLFGSTAIRRNIWRHYFGRIFATVVSNLLQMSVYDTQCGAKLFEKSTAEELFEEPFISKWLFDIELIYRLRMKYKGEEIQKHLCEVPLRSWNEKGASKVSPFYLFRIPFELLKISFKYR